jgi:hypothetical protein
MRNDSKRSSIGALNLRRFLQLPFGWWLGWGNSIRSKRKASYWNICGVDELLHLRWNSDYTRSWLSSVRCISTTLWCVSRARWNLSLAPVNHSRSTMGTIALTCHLHLSNTQPSLLMLSYAWDIRKSPNALGILNLRCCWLAIPVYAYACGYTYSDFNAVPSSNRSHFGHWKAIGPWRRLSYPQIGIRSAECRIFHIEVNEESLPIGGLSYLFINITRFAIFGSCLSSTVVKSNRHHIFGWPTCTQVALLENCVSLNHVLGDWRTNHFATVLFPMKAVY